MTAIRTKIRNADTGAVVDMDLEPDNSMDEVIESACSYWDKDAGAYVLRKGKKVLRGQTKISDADVHAGDVLELIPDPEGG